MSTPDNAKRICPVDDEPCDGCAGVRAPCDDATGTIAEECAKCIDAAPAILPIVPKLMPFTAPTCGIAKEEWARKELDSLNKHEGLRRAYFGDNGPTGHGDICHSDADPGL